MTEMTGKKTAFIIDCFDDYEIRLKYVKEALEREGYETSIYLSNFDHYAKEYVKEKRNNVNYLPVPAYQKNLSYARIHSHTIFAKECKKLIAEQKPDLVYCIVPPNTLTEEIGKYKLEHKQDFKLVFDICDMWPETFPSHLMKVFGALPFAIWKAKRDNYLKYADCIITECDLFKNILKKKTEESKIHSVYLCKKQVVKEPIQKDGPLNFVYLGSINSIIDIDGIVDFLKEVNAITPAHLDVIGDGEKASTLKEKLNDNNLPNTFHGKIYNEDEKKKIYEHCHYGLNFMKDSVCVGLTMKSLDYFAYDIPLINNIVGDSWDLIKKYNIGFNVNKETIKKAAYSAAHLKNYSTQQENIISIHQKYFDEECCISSIQKQIHSL